MAKILLINPPFNFWREDQAALRRYLGTTLSSFGLALLAAALRREHGEDAERLWLWRQLVSREEARR